MDSLAFIAEQKIAEAMRERDLNSPKWKNKPLPLDDDSFVPDDLKMAYKILKNSGYLPPEVEERKEIKKLEDLITRTDDEHERLKQMKKLNVLLMKVDARRPFSSNISSQHDYYRKVVEKITLHSKDKGGK
ncbi:DnaJ family domain-containing protein [Desulfocastanea catecholica]